MAARKLTINGNGVDSTIKVTIDGTEYYNGPINNVSSQTDVLATVSFDNDNSVTTTRSMSIEVLTGLIEIGDCQYNLVNVVNPALTPTEMAFISIPAAEIPPSIASSVAAKGGFVVNGENYFGAGGNGGADFDSRSNIQINGFLQNTENNPDPTNLFVPIAGWTWEIPEGSAISFNLAVPAQQTL